MNRLEQEPLIEFTLAIYPNGQYRMAASKLDQYDAARVGMIFSTALRGLTVWAENAGIMPAGVVGDGGPEIARLRAKLYELLEAQKP